MNSKTIAVFFGGCSTEHEVSLQSAQAVLNAIDRERYLPLAVGITKKGEWRLFSGNLDRLADGSWEPRESIFLGKGRLQQAAALFFPHAFPLIICFSS